jgi:hypothetical protein
VASISTVHRGPSRRISAATFRKAAIVLGLAAPLVFSGTGAWAGPLLPSPTPTPSPTLTPVPGGVRVDVNFHGMWSTYTDAERIAVLDSLRWAGSTSVRIDVSWGMLQPTNATSYDAWGVGFVDRVIAMSNARGLKPLIMLWMTPGWANGNRGERTLPTNPADHARVATFGATKWRG